MSGGGPPDPPFKARREKRGGPPFCPSEISLWVDMYDRVLVVDGVVDDGVVGKKV